MFLCKVDRETSVRFTVLRTDVEEVSDFTASRLVRADLTSSRIVLIAYVLGASRF